MVFFYYHSVDPRALHSFPTRRSSDLGAAVVTKHLGRVEGIDLDLGSAILTVCTKVLEAFEVAALRSEEHTSELQSRRDLVCRLLLEKKNFSGYPPGSCPGCWLAAYCC